MKSIDFVDEMTMRGGNFEKAALSFVNANKDYWFQNGKHIGDIDQFTVKKLLTMYSIWNKDEVVACASLDIVPDQYAVVDAVWVSSAYRGQKIFSKLLWFFKTRERQTKLVLGDVHSKDMQEVTKGLTRFRKLWIDKEGKTAEYSPETVDKFYSWGGKTGWRLMLENTGDFTDWPRYTTGTSEWIKESYDWQIE